MTPMEYLKYTMQSLSNVLYNTSQNDMQYNSKDTILDTIKNMIYDYNSKVDADEKIECTDFRNK